MNERKKKAESGQTTIDPQTLLDYLEGRLPDLQKHELESLLADSAFLDEALQGLEAVRDKSRIPSVVNELNKQLAMKIRDRKKKKASDIRGFPPWLLLTTIAIMVLMVLAFVIYKMYTTP